MRGPEEVHTTLQLKQYGVRVSHVLVIINLNWLFNILMPTL